MNSLAVANLCPNRDLNAYIAAVYQMPMLSAEEEKQLAKDLFENGELESAQKLVLAHLRVVVSVSRQYLSYGLSQADIIQEGNVGLMKAVRRFDPGNGARLFSFAIHWIKAEIHEFILRNWKIVKVATTKAQRKLFFNLRSLKRQLNCSESLTEDEVTKIADTLKVNNHDVEEMNVRLSYSDSSIDYQEENGLSQSLKATGGDPYEILSNDQEQSKVKIAVAEALKELDDRSKQIIEARWLKLKEGAKPKTLKELADDLDISAERVRQIETAAFKKLKEKLSSSF
jgi:RNA polymerase sigma-32 factor